MNDHCSTCEVENLCGYPHKTTDCCNLRKFQPKDKLFIGMEETNIADFVSPCCKGALSLEPLCRVTCGICGKAVNPDDAVYVLSLEKDHG